MHYTVSYSKCKRIGKRKVRWEFIMDFSNRGNNPAQQQQVAPQGDTGRRQAPSRGGGKMKINLNKASQLIVLLGVSIILAALVVVLVFGGKTKDTNKESSLVDTSRYQAVFLNSQDGQVYFGKLSIYNDNLYMLDNIYYVRVNNPIQPEDPGQQAQANISLAKLGNELHGPEDKMFIARDKVLYWENLKDDGQVVKAITEFKAKGETNSQQDTTTPTTPATPTTPTTPTTPAATPATP